MSQISSVEFEPTSPISLSSIEDLPKAIFEQPFTESFDHDKKLSLMIQSDISHVQNPLKNKRIGI